MPNTSDLHIELPLPRPAKLIRRDSAIAVTPLDSATPVVSRPSTPGGRKITYQELEQHNTPESAWVAVRNVVYDLTEFFDKHPGGPDILGMSIGRDATMVFEASHEAKHFAVLKKYAIGELKDNRFPEFPQDSEFAQELRLAVKGYFKNNKLDVKWSWTMPFRYGSILSMVVLSYYLQYFNQTVANHLSLQLGSAILFGSALAQVCFNLIHDGSHGCVTHNWKVWRWMAACHDLLIGGSSLCWFHQHVLGHHPFTNLDGVDPDIAANVEVDFRRILPSQKHHFFYNFQHIYAPIVYCFLGMKVRIKDAHQIYVKKSVDAIKINPLTPLQHGIFWFGKLAFVLTRFVIPKLVTNYSWSRIILLFALGDFVLSWTLALVFQANHVVDEVLFPEVKNGRVEMDWCKMQVETSQDYAHDSLLTTKLVGGLNYQVLHHLFPQIAQPHFPTLAPIIKEICQKHGVKYRVKTGFMEAFGGHIGLLKYLSSGEAVWGHGAHHHHEHHE